MKKMHIFTLACVLFLITSVIAGCSSKPAEIKKDIITNSDETKEAVYYVNDKEVAREKLGQYGEVLETTGAIPDGIAKRYYPDGTVQEVIPYKGGKINGIAKSYHEGGELAWEGTVKQGKLVGLSKRYYKNGQISWEGSYKDGKLDGEAQGYYENGKVKFKAPYKNGNSEGISLHYYENGSPEYEMSYKDGKQDGVTKKYYENGNLEYEIAYKQGKRDGISKNYYENGRLEQENTFKDNDWDGAWKEYYEDGLLKREAVYKEGKQVTSVYYGPQNTGYYENLKMLITKADGMVTMVQSAGDVTYEQFNSWYEQWKPLFKAWDDKYDYKAEETSYVLLESHKLAENMDSTLWSCVMSLSIDKSEKLSAQNSSYATYTGKYKTDFWQKWNEFLQDLSGIKKSVAERK